jgi:hypothetical protein
MKLSVEDSKAFCRFLTAHFEHVDFVPDLGKGIGYEPIIRYSLETERLIVTYDDQFVLGVEENDYRAVL